MLIAKIKRDEYRIGVAANRVKRNTLVYQSLMKFFANIAHADHSYFARLANMLAPQNQGWDYGR